MTSMFSEISKVSLQRRNTPASSRDHFRVPKKGQASKPFQGRPLHCRWTKCIVYLSLKFFERNPITQNLHHVSGSFFLRHPGFEVKGCVTQIQLELLFAKNSGLLEKGITNRSLAFNHFLRGGNSSIFQISSFLWREPILKLEPVFIPATYFKKAVNLRCFLMASILFFSFLKSLKFKKGKNTQLSDVHCDFYHVSPFTLVHIPEWYLMSWE